MDQAAIEILDDIMGHCTRELFSGYGLRLETKPTVPVAPAGSGEQQVIATLGYIADEMSGAIAIAGDVDRTGRGAWANTEHQV